METQNNLLKVALVFSPFLFVNETEMREKIILCTGTFAFAGTSAEYSACARRHDLLDDFHFLFLLRDLSWVLTKTTND